LGASVLADAAEVTAAALVVVVLKGLAELPLALLLVLLVVLSAE
jgi:hypothetical protein